MNRNLLLYGLLAVVVYLLLKQGEPQRVVVRQSTDQQSAGPNDLFSQVLGLLQAGAKVAQNLTAQKTVESGSNDKTSSIETLGI